MYPAWIVIFVITVISCILFLCLSLLRWLNKALHEIVKKHIDDALVKRSSIEDHFQTINGYSWDFVIVFKIYNEEEELNDEQIQYNLKFILNRLSNGGLDFELFYGSHVKEVFCKIRASPERLIKEADRIDLKVLLESAALRTLCKSGRFCYDNEELLWKPLKIPDVSRHSNISPYEFIYCHVDYDSKTELRPDLKNLYKRKTTNISDLPESNSYNGLIFRGVDRLKLIDSIITSKFDGCCKLDIKKLLEFKCIKVFEYPWNLDVVLLKDYFGEKIGLYFVWLQYYTIFLIPAAIVSVLAWVWIAVNNNNPSSLSVPYFAGFIALWSSLFLEFWKRKEKYTSMQWGMVGFEESEEIRPQFLGVKTNSPVDGKIIMAYPPFQRIPNIFKSYLMIFFMVILSLGVMAVIFYVRSVMVYRNTDINGKSVSVILTSLFLAFQIDGLNAGFTDIAISLNDSENHRTETNYEDALIAKIFFFQFFNSFSSLFYISFTKPFIPSIDSCVNDNCMNELQETLGTIFLSRIILSNSTELLYPLLLTTWKTHRRSRGNDESSSRNTSDATPLFHTSSKMQIHEFGEIEQLYNLPVYDIMLGPINDYVEMIIQFYIVFDKFLITLTSSLLFKTDQFGFATMFVAGFPLAVLMSLVCNYVEQRVDMWKMFHLYRRPIPRSCEDIGTWFIILEIMSMSAVFVNSGIVAYTELLTDNRTWTERIWIFFLMSSGLISIRLLVAYLIPDIPKEVDIQLKRQEYIIGKVFKNIKDEDDDRIAKHLNLIPDYSVRLMENY